MDDGTKQWIDHKELSQILIVSTDNPKETATSETIIPTANPTNTASPDQIDEVEINEFIKNATSTIEETINKIIDILKSLF